MCILPGAVALVVLFSMFGTMTVTAGGVIQHQAGVIYSDLEDHGHPLPHNQSDEDAGKEQSLPFEKDEKNIFGGDFIETTVAVVEPFPVFVFSPHLTHCSAVPSVGRRPLFILFHNLKVDSAEIR